VLSDLVIPLPPTLAQFSLLLPDEIAEAVKTYMYALQLLLQLDKDTFIAASAIYANPVQQMILLLFSHSGQISAPDPSSLSSGIDEKIFNLLFRFVSEGRDVSTWIDPEFILSVICCWYNSKALELSLLISRLWRRSRQKMTQEFTQLRDSYVNSFESIILDDSHHITVTFTGLRYMVTLNSDIVDLLLDPDGAFLSTLHDHYAVYRIHLSAEEREAIIYLFYTLLLNLAFRASESSLGQNKKGKAVVGSSETLFFQFFERFFSAYAHEGVYDEFIETLRIETPFVDVMTEWSDEWKGAEEPVETLKQYLTRVKLEESGNIEDSGPVEEVAIDDDVCLYDSPLNNRRLVLKRHRLSPKSWTFYLILRTHLLKIV